MSLEKTINEALTNAMKQGDKIRVNTLRSIRAGIIEFAKSGAEKEMTAEDELKILNSNAKKRKDAIEIYIQANRPELAEKEKAELEIIQEFLPKQLSDEEIKEVVLKIISELNASNKDIGKVIGAAMKELKGKADGAKVQSVVKSLLVQT